MTIHIRNAQSKDVHQLAELARVGYETSPVYSFVRTKAREFPEDTEKSYRQELRVLIANPRLLFTVLEVTVDDHNHCTSAIRAQRDKRKCHTGSKRWDFKLCGATTRKIVGFAIWRLNPKSQEIHESLLNDLKCKSSNTPRASAEGNQLTKLRRLCFSQGPTHFFILEVP